MDMQQDNTRSQGPAKLGDWMKQELEFRLPRAWLAAGGAAYTLGVVFYAADHRIPHGHGLWHLFVLGGSVCHFFTVFFYVA